LLHPFMISPCSARPLYDEFLSFWSRTDTAAEPSKRMSPDSYVLT